MTGRLFIVAAPSGAGKTSLISAVIKQLGKTYSLERVITYTSRKPREGERHGADYHFISHNEFWQKINEGFFIEWSDAYGNYYGSPASIVDELAQGTSCIIILDRVGTEAIQQIIEDAVLLWIYTKTLDVLRERLVRRARNSLEQIDERLVIARRELEEERLSPLYHHHILNDEFEKTVKKMTKIVRNSLYSMLL